MFGSVLQLALDQRDRTARRAGECFRARRLVVGASSAGTDRLRRAARDHAEAHHLRIRQQALEVGGVRGVGSGERCSVEGRGAVLKNVSSLPGSRSEKSTSRSARSAEASTSPPAAGDRAREQPVVGADLVIRSSCGRSVAEQDESDRCARWIR